MVAQAHAIVEETEGRTLVVPTSAARDAGAAVEASWVWLTLTVHSSLEAVGLTAAFSAALAEVNIPCNVIAGAHHDHLLVPEDRTEDAIRALRSLCASN